jgi:hypothetical protein
VKNDKTPGSDGYSAEFFLFLWKDLQIFIVNSLNYGYDIGELSVTHKARYNNLLKFKKLQYTIQKFP